MAFEFRRSQYVGISAGAASGSLVFGALPFVVGAAITKFGDPAAAGLAASLELVAMGLASILVSAKLPRLPGRVTGSLAGMLLTVGHVISGMAIAWSDWRLFLIGRTVAGIGEGSLYTICNAFAAKAPRPDRAFTAIAFAQTIFNALFFTTMAFVNMQYDPVRTFVLFTIFSAAAIALILLIPNARTSDDAFGDAMAAKTAFQPVVRRVLVGFAAYSVALYMLFPYVENIGTVAGFTHAQVATVLAFSSLAALLGPIVVAGIGMRFGRAMPIFIAIAIQIVAALVLVHSRALLVWGGAELVSIAMLYLLTPLMFGLTAHLEPTGRCAAVATAIMAITAAIGPAISSAVLTFTSSYVVLGWFNAGVYVLMAIIVLEPLRHARRTSLPPEAQFTSTEQESRAAGAHPTVA